MSEEIKKLIHEFGELLSKYTELPDRKCLYDRTDITNMQLYYCSLVTHIESLYRILDEAGWEAAKQMEDQE